MNKVILIGRCVRDPQLRFTVAGTSITKFSLAVDRRFRQQDGPSADFFNCVAWGKTTEFIAQYFHKGKQMALVGRMQTGSYDKDGVKHYTTDIVVEQVEFVGSKRDDAGAANDHSDLGLVIDFDDNVLPF